MSPIKFLHTDRLGAVQAATNGSASVVWSATYNPFGDTNSFSGTLTTQSLRLPGQTFDPETGYNHNGFRDYAGTLTRYMQPDPTGLVGGMNTYQYVLANPFKYTDPRGLDPNQSNGGGSSPAPKCPGFVGEQQYGGCSSGTGGDADSIQPVSVFPFVPSSPYPPEPSNTAALWMCEGASGALCKIPLYLKNYPMFGLCEVTTGAGCYLLFEPNITNPTMDPYLPTWDGNSTVGPTASVKKPGPPRSLG